MKSHVHVHHHRAHSNGTLLFRSLYHSLRVSISLFLGLTKFGRQNLGHENMLKTIKILCIVFFFMFFRKINSICAVTAVTASCCCCCCVFPSCFSLSLALAQWLAGQLIKLHTADFALFGLSLRLIADYMICMYVCDFEGGYLMRPYVFIQCMSLILRGVSRLSS